MGTKFTDCIWTRTHDQLVHKWTLSGLVKPASLAKWLSVLLWTKWLFESSYSHLNFRFRACFEQGVPSHPGNYWVWIHSETRTWHGHDKNIKLSLSNQMKKLPGIVNNMTQCSDVEREFFLEITMLLRLHLVFPATNAVSERSVSTMRHQKLDTQHDIQKRLNHAMLLSIHKENIVCTSFISQKCFVKEMTKNNALFLYSVK